MCGREMEGGPECPLTDSRTPRQVENPGTGEPQWPQMSRYVGQYSATCDLCLWTKAHKKLPTSYLEPLLTPDCLWYMISVDFIVKLPESDGHGVIMVVVDSLTKRGHFLLVNTTITA